MPPTDPVAQLEAILLARGMQGRDLPGFIRRYAKSPPLIAARELQKRGIHYHVAFHAIAALRSEETSRASFLADALNPTAGISGAVGIACYCGGLWVIQHGLFKAQVGPWLYVVLFALGTFFIIRAISKWLGS